MSLSGGAVGPKGLDLSDWENVVSVYVKGRSTLNDRPVGGSSDEYSAAVAAVAAAARGGGDDRKRVEKWRTTGRAFELLGRPLFEEAIGYKRDADGRRTKQKIYLVVARCRVVSEMRRKKEAIPENPAELTALIDRRLEEKQQERKRTRQDREGGGSSVREGGGAEPGGAAGTGAPRGAEAAGGVGPADAPGAGTAGTAGQGSGGPRGGGGAEEGEGGDGGGASRVEPPARSGR
ncbi:hypothetical protein MMPV_008527 [Pyropia vietnamensis]